MSGADDIRDIRLPAPQPLRDFLAQYWPWLVAALAVLLACALAWRWWRGRAAQPPAASLLERTLAELEEARPLMQAGEVQGFSTRVSDVVRHYIEQRFQFQARRLTTREFLRDCLASADSPLAAQRQELQQFLQFCDLAKFARWSPSGPEMEALLASARAFVQHTGHATSARMG